MKLIEYGHLYVDDLIRNQYNTQSLRQGIFIARQVAGASDTCWVLLDDKALSLNEQARREVIHRANGLFDELGLVPQSFHFEKAFAKDAPHLIDALPQEALRWESFRKDNKQVLFYSRKGSRIPLAQRAMADQDSIKTIQYSCPLLASLWRKYKQEHYEVSVTILEDRYKLVESQVNHLLKDSGYRTNGRHSYIWH